MWIGVTRLLIQKWTPGTAIFDHGNNYACLFFAWGRKLFVCRDIAVWYDTCPYLLRMEGPHKERWQQLCKLVAEEKDPVRFQQLVQELIAELDKKDERLRNSNNETSTR